MFTIALVLVLCPGAHGSTLDFRNVISKIALDSEFSKFSHYTVSSYSCKV